MTAAASLLRRAAALLESDPPRRLELLPELGRGAPVLRATAPALPKCWSAVEEAAASGDRRLEQLSRVEQALLRLNTDPDVATEDTIAVAERALAAFSELGDEGGLARAWSLVGHANWLLCRSERMEDAFTRAGVGGASGRPARGRLDPAHARARLLPRPTPVEQAIARCEEILERGRGHVAIEVSTRAKIAMLEAMRGRFGRSATCTATEGRSARSSARPGARGAAQLLGLIERCSRATRKRRSGSSAPVAVRSRSWARRRCSRRARRSSRARLSTWAARRGGGIHDPQPAKRFRDDVASQATWRAVRARILARRGELGGSTAARTRSRSSTGPTSSSGAAKPCSTSARCSGGRSSASFARAVNDALRLFEAKATSSSRSGHARSCGSGRWGFGLLDCRFAPGIRSPPTRRSAMSTFGEQLEPPGQDADEEAGSIEPPQSPAEAGRDSSTCARPAATRRSRSTGLSFGLWRSLASTLTRVSEAAHRRGCAGRRCGDHDGLRRRLPDLSRQKVRGPGGPLPGREEP